MGLFEEFKGTLPNSTRKSTAKPSENRGLGAVRKTIAAHSTLVQGEGSDVCIFGDADEHFNHDGIVNEAEHAETCGFDAEDLIKHIVIGDILNNPRFKR